MKTIAIEPPRYNEDGVIPVQTRAFTVLLKPQKENGFFVECPDLKGCYSQGSTVEEALANIQEAIQVCLEDDDGEELSGPVLVTSVIVTR